MVQAHSPCHDLVPRTQALRSKSFALPPLNEFSTIPEIYEWHMGHSSNHHLFMYQDEECNHVKAIPYSRAVPAAHRVASTVMRRIAGTSNFKPEVRPVIAVLASADTITYFTTIVGILQAGLVCFPISPRNSSAAVAHLIRTTGVTHVLAGREQSLQELVQTSIKNIVADDPTAVEPTVSDMLTFEELYLPQTKGSLLEESLIQYRKPEPADPAIILHSSGSTSFPKAITWTHMGILKLGLSPWFGQKDLCGMRVSMHGVPMFHATGFGSVVMAAMTGMVVVAFKPKLPATIPSPDGVLRGVIATESQIIFSVPTFAETWANDPSALEHLRKTFGIAYGGGPLSKAAGDHLVANGVRVHAFYGCTEAGMINRFFLSEIQKDWDYFQITPALKHVFVSHDQQYSELVVLSNGFASPAVFNTKYNGISAYATSDLLEPHPTKPGFWRIYGRVDDQIMHSNGEKTNPGPLENILNRDPHIQISLMFGRGKFHPGALVVPKPEYAFDPSDTEKVAEFRNKIWPTVEKMNQFAPQHSRIFKESILVASPSKPFAYTAKGTVRRQVVINDYEQEIDKLYDLIEETTQVGFEPPKIWTASETLAFVRAVVHKVMKKDVPDTVDVFQHGCDSLQATWIRNAILQAIRRTTQLKTQSVPQNFVYQYPAVADLATFISSLFEAPMKTEEEEAADRLTAMSAMMNKYTVDFPKHVPASDAVPAGDVVLLTGSTGGLGSNLLAELVRTPGIARVYTLDRKAAKGAPAGVRQRRALEERGLDACLLNSSKVTLLEGDLATEGFGLEPTMMDELRRSVTHIVHNAWRVDFNLALSSFETNVQGVRSLVDFALSSPLPSPATILFTSSIGVVRNFTDDMADEEPVEAQNAAGTGYGESKWVGEKILELARLRTPMHTVNIRIGQLSGSVNGSWNTAEWFPSLVRSSVTMGCLPDCGGVSTWVPLPLAARTIVECLHTTESNLHLSHPKPVSWSTIVSAFSEELGVPVVPHDEWLRKLEDISATSSEGPSLRDIPALQLLDFFRAARTRMSATCEPEAMGLPRLSVRKTLRASKALAEAPSLDINDVRLWISYWKSVGFM